MIAIIPARYGSSRLPGKPLREIAGVPMVVRVWQRARRARRIARLLVATDDQRIATVVRTAGGEAMLTSSSHPSGTDRLAEVAQALAAEVYLNVQGDLPFVEPDDLDALAAAMVADPDLSMATLGTPITSLEEWYNPNVVKVVCGPAGDALYFSRSPIPFARDGGLPAEARRHIGVYAYRRALLLRLAALEPGVLEGIEKLEQLRALEHGYRIRVVPSLRPSLEVDTADDLARACELAARSEQMVGR